MEVFKKALIAAKNNHPDLLPEVIIDILSTGMDYAKGAAKDNLCDNRFLLTHTEDPIEAVSILKAVDGIMMVASVSRQNVPVEWQIRPAEPFADEEEFSALTAKVKAAQIAAEAAREYSK